MIISFDNLRISNEILKGLYAYGLEKPSTLQFDLIRLFLEESKISNVVIEKPFYMIEKYESIIISSLQKRGRSLIIAEDKREIEKIYSLFQYINKYLKRPISKYVFQEKYDINIITLYQFNKFKNKVCYNFYVDNIYFLSTNTDTKNIITQFFTTLTNIFIFDYRLDNYQGFTKYYNNKMNIFEPKQLQNYYMTINSRNDKYNGKCIDTFYKNNSIEQAIIYLEDLTMINKLYECLSQKDYPVCCFYEGMTIQQQNVHIESFISGNSRLCICTDKSNLEFMKLLANENMNFERITHIIHLDTPKIEYYLLRIPFHIETKHIFIMDLSDVDSFEHKQILEDYFDIQMKNI
jgi:superfamily II DNA/RNA helicase